MLLQGIDFYFWHCAFNLNPTTLHCRVGNGTEHLASVGKVPTYLSFMSREREEKMLSG